MTQKKSDELLTLGDYVERAQEDTRLKRTTHSYIADMFLEYTRDEIFPSIKGNEYQIDLLGQYFFGGANFGSLSERLVLQLGPNGTGKTTMCNDLKNSVISYSKTDSGLSYAVAGCPFNQHPFDIIPLDERKKMGIVWHAEACPCPVCDLQLDKCGGKWDSMPINRFYYGKKKGLAEHTAADQRREDILEFLGDVDYSKVNKVEGGKSSPEAYDWQGKFVWANRGILDWDEILKSRRQLLTPLLMLTQSKSISYPKFPKLHSDLVIIGATNWGEYRQALKDDLLEPLFGRAFVIEYFYTISQKEETEIVKVRARQMNDYANANSGKGPKCINETILREYVSKMIVTTRKDSANKENDGRQGFPPRVTLDIFSNAYNNAMIQGHSCISFEDYTKSYERIITSEAKKNPELANNIALNSQLENVVKKELFDHLWSLVKGSLSSTSEEFKRIGQSKYIEYLNILEKKSQGLPLTQRDLDFSIIVTKLLSTESKKEIQDQEAFERIVIARLPEYKTKHYTQVEKLQSVISELVSNNLVSVLKNYSYDENSLTNTDKSLLEDLASEFTKKKIGCKSCSYELMKFLGKNL